MKPIRPPKPTQKTNLALPWCVICDIDGTLAHMKDRGPFDWARVGTDELDEQVALVLEAVRAADEKYRIILLSGRDGSCEPETVAWLEEHWVDYDDLFMRTAGDNRKDSIIKRELYEKHIADKYNVLCVFDDRNQVVDMWRNELGLTCFQVAEGDF